jgi:hypothetical protein
LIRGCRCSRICRTPLMNGGSANGGLSTIAGDDHPTVTAAAEPAKLRSPSPHTQKQVTLATLFASRPSTRPQARSSAHTLATGARRPAVVPARQRRARLSGDLSPGTRWCVAIDGLSLPVLPPRSPGMQAAVCALSSSAQRQILSLCCQDVVAILSSMTGERVGRREEGTAWGLASSGVSGGRCWRG